MSVLLLCADCRIFFFLKVMNTQCLVVVLKEFFLSLGQYT